MAAFQTYRARAAKSSGKEIETLRSDGGGEVLSKRFQQYLRDAGIQHTVSPQYRPAQNRLAERMNRRIMDNARWILQDSTLDYKFWGEAVLMAAYIHNRLRSSTRNDMSPIAHWTGKEGGLGHLRVFGSTAWVHIPKEKRCKLDPRSRKCILVGYDEDVGSKVYRLQDPEHMTILQSRDIIIDESLEPAGEAKRESHKATIGWDAKITIDEEKIRENTSEKFHLLKELPQLQPRPRPRPRP